MLSFGRLLQFTKKETNINYHYLLRNVTVKANIFVKSMYELNKQKLYLIIT